MHTVRIIVQRVMLLILTAMGLACSTLHAQAHNGAELVGWVRQHATPVETPTVWRMWWDSLAVECDCQPAVQFDAVELYVVQGRDFQLPRRFGHSLAAWLWDGQIVISSDRLADSRVVKHELLHAMLGASNGGGHPTIFRKLGLDDDRL